MVLFKYMMGSQSRNRGFTIVELLIVIVVIGILAAITIVSFNGVSAKAKNTQTISAVETYQKALAGYAAENGAYPVTLTANNTVMCLGTGYKDYDANGSADCGDVNQSYRASVNTTFNSSIAQYMGGSTTGPTMNAAEMITYTNNTYVGAVVGKNASMTVDGVSNPYYLEYILSGTNQKCNLRAVATSAFPAMTSTTQGYSWSDSGHNSTNCVVPLPNV